VLAVEERCIQVLDVDTHQPCFVQIEAVVKETSSFKETTLSLMSPCLVPEFHLIKKISINSPRYWPQVLYLEDNPSLLALSKRKVIFVKRKTGFQSYAYDPKGFQSILSRSFPKQSQFTERKHKNNKEFIQSFSADPNVLAFAHHFCNDLSAAASSEEPFGTSFATSVLYECLTHEKPEMLPIYLQLHRSQLDFGQLLTSHFVWNFKLLLSYYNNFQRSDPLLNASFLVGLKLKLESFFGELGLTSELPVLLKSYMKRSCLPKFEGKNATRMCIFFGCYLAYLGVPHPQDLNKILSDCAQSQAVNAAKHALLLALAKRMKGVPPSTILKLATATEIPMK
jgi:anaphase-promoting complex subunit 1